MILLEQKSKLINSLQAELFNFQIDWSISKKRDKLPLKSLFRKYSTIFHPSYTKRLKISYLVDCQDPRV